MGVVLLSTSVADAPEVPDEVRAARLATLIAHLVAREASGQISYWASFCDDRGVSHYALTTDPAYAAQSLENAASRAGAVTAFSKAIERYRASVVELRSAR